ncbi:MAG TPA: protein-disulfide reductase DsbD [Sulfurimonas sp.]|nr:protein-disulfide reductase DsbD [Sulfurimonas sp.]
MKNIISFFSLLFILFSPLSAQNSFFTLDEAFVIKAVTVDNKAIINFSLAKDIYVYSDQVSVKIKENKNVTSGPFSLPLGHDHDGEIVYFNAQNLEIPLLKRVEGSGIVDYTLIVNYQGCSDKGLCYEPSVKNFDLSVDMSKLSMTGSKVDNSIVEPQEDILNDDPISSLLSGGNIGYIIIGFFGFGLLLSLTPCVFPMIPILSSVIVSHGSEITTKKAFVLSMIYVQAMALSYTIAGVVAGLSGAGVQAAFQTPWVIGLFSGVFVVLALSMFGLFEIQMPQALQSYLNKKSDGSGKGYVSIAIMGFLSALIVGPCVAAPLASALVFISQTGDAVLGGMALYALSMGMGFPLLLVGTGAGKFMPRPGGWMDAVKSIFGVMMLGVAIWMLARILDESLVMFLWAGLLVFIAASIGAFDSRKEDALCGPCYAGKKALGLMVFLIAVSLFIGSITGAKDLLNPLEKLTSTTALIPNGVSSEVKENTFTKIHSIDELDKIMSESKGKKIMVDFAADWCTACKELEHFTFSDPRVKVAWKDYVLVQADVTKNTDQEKDLSKKFGLFGPPALVFFNENGKEIKKKRVIGFIPADELLEKL